MPGRLFSVQQKKGCAHGFWIGTGFVFLLLNGSVMAIVCLFVA